MILTFSFKFWCDYLDMSAVRPFVLLSLNSLAGFFFAWFTIFFVMLLWQKCRIQSLEKLILVENGVVMPPVVQDIKIKVDLVREKLEVNKH